MSGDVQFTRRRTFALFASALAVPFIVRPQEAAAAPGFAKIGTPRPLAASQSGQQFGARLAAFDSGAHGFVATWRHFPTFGVQPPFARFFNLEGGATTNPIRLGGRGPTAANFSSSICPVTFRNGAAHIYFSADRRNGNGFPDIFLQKMAPTGQKNGLPTFVQGGPEGQIGLVAARRTDGRAQIVYGQFDGTSDEFARGSVVLTDGSVAEANHLVLGPSTQVLASALAALGSGETLAAITHLVVVGGRLQLQALVQRIGANGRRVGPALPLKTRPEGSFAGNAGAGSLARGRALLAYFGSESGDLALRLFQNGSLGRELIRGSTEIDPVFVGAPQVAALRPPAGPPPAPAAERVVVVTNGAQEGGGFWLDAWLFDGNGRRLAGPTRLLQAGVRLSATSLVCLRNRAFAVAYQRGDDETRSFVQRFRVTS